MKKTAGGRFCCLVASLIAIAIAIAFAFAACKSAPGAGVAEGGEGALSVADEEPVYVPSSFEEINPLALLGDGLGIYVNIPASRHVSLTSSLLMEEIENMSRKDAETVAKHIDNLYAGQGTVTDRSLLEVGARGTMPTIAVRTTFTKKNGWTKNSYEAVSTEDALKRKYPHSFSYYSREDSDYKIAFTSQELFCLSQDIATLLERYALRPEVADAPYTNWISQESDDILFYVTRPEDYLQNLIGRQLSAGTDYIYGRLAYLSDDSYAMTLRLHVVSARTITALKSLLSLSFGLSGGTVTQLDGDTLELSGVELTEEQIIAMLTSGGRAGGTD